MGTMARDGLCQQCISGYLNPSSPTSLLQKKLNSKLLILKKSCEQKQSPRDVLQTRCSEKNRKFHRNTSALLWCTFVVEKPFFHGSYSTEYLQSSVSV